MEAADWELATTTYDVRNQARYSVGGAERITSTFDFNVNQQIVREPNGDRTIDVWDIEDQSILGQLASGSRGTMALNADLGRVSKES